MHSKEIMSGKLSTPRDEKEKICSDNNHHPPDNNNRHMSNNSNLRGVHLGDKNHQRYLSPSDITCQYPDSNMNHNYINNLSIEKNCDDNNRFPYQSAYNYKNQLSCSIQLGSSFQNTPISSSSPGTNELDIFSSQRNRRKLNPSYDQKFSKYKPLNYKIETSMFSNKNWPTYKPISVTYPDGVMHSKLQTKLV